MKAFFATVRFVIKGGYAGVLDLTEKRVEHRVRVGEPSIKPRIVELELNSRRPGGFLYFRNRRRTIAVTDSNSCRGAVASVADDMSDDDPIGG